MAFLRGFNSNDLSAYGLATPGHKGLLGPADRSNQIYRLPGSDVPQVVTTGLKEKTTQVSCSIGAATHADLVTNLELLWGALLPDDDFHLLETTDYASRGIMAYLLSAPIDTDKLPGWIRTLQFPLTFLTFPFWQDLVETEVLIEDAAGSISNVGQMRCYPTYTLEATDAIAGGVEFDVNGLTWEWTTALELGDVLVVDCDPTVQTVTLNGVETMASVALTARFPYLEVGANAVTRTESAKSTLTAAFAQRYR